jgi:hypothetical protein
LELVLEGAACGPVGAGDHVEDELAAGGDVPGARPAAANPPADTDVDHGGAGRQQPVPAVAGNRDDRNDDQATHHAESTSRLDASKSKVRRKSWTSFY